METQLNPNPLNEKAKLDFKDVLIRPKRSTLSSRKEVDISREYKMGWSGKTFKGVPVIAANMDGVGTFEMAKAFMKDGNGLTVALHKHYPLEELVEFFEQHGGESVWYSIGFAKADQEKLEEYMGIVKDIQQNILMIKAKQEINYTMLKYR
mgnify:CR=1 FL=1